MSVSASARSQHTRPAQPSRTLFLYTIPFLGSRPSSIQWSTGFDCDPHTAILWGVQMGGSHPFVRLQHLPMAREGIKRWDTRNVARGADDVCAWPYLTLSPALLFC
jgi:hypothetical protein